MAKTRAPGAGEMTCREAGHKGGTTTSQRHRAEGHYQKIGALGGEATREAHGPEHYERIGKMGGARTRALVAAGKKAEG